MAVVMADVILDGVTIDVVDILVVVDAVVMLLWMQCRCCGC